MSAQTQMATRRHRTVERKVKVHTCVAMTEALAGTTVVPPSRLLQDQILLLNRSGEEGKTISF